MTKNIGKEISYIEEEIGSLCNKFNYDKVNSEEYFVHYHLKEDWDQSSMILKIAGGYRGKREPRATSVSIQLDPIPSSVDSNSAESNFENFVRELPKRPGQYNATENTTWINYSNMSTDEFVNIIKYIVDNWDTEAIYR